MQQAANCNANDTNEIKLLFNKRKKKKQTKKHEELLCYLAIKNQMKIEKKEQVPFLF